MRKPRDRRRAMSSDDGPEPSIRTSNVHERRVCLELEALGYEVLKSGWPDLVAIRGDEVHFIEVKPPNAAWLSGRQRRMAEVLAQVGIRVRLAPGRLPREIR